MNEPMELEDVLAGKEEVVEPQAEEKVEEAAQPEEVEAVEETEPTAEVEAAPDEPKGVEEAEPPSAKESKEVPIGALLDERDKRKTLQAELDRIKAEQEKEQESPDFWADPQKAIDSVKQELWNDYQQQRTSDRLEFSMQLARQAHDDYDVQLESFKVAAEQNPALVDQALAQDHPGEYIYTTGRQFSQLEAAGGDFDSMREQIRAEIMDELANKEKASQTKLAAVPTPITETTSAGSPNDKVEGGPPSLESIFSGNN